VLVNSAVPHAILLSTDRDAGIPLSRTSRPGRRDARGRLVSPVARLGLMSFVFTQALYAAWFERWYHTAPPAAGRALVAAEFPLLFSLWRRPRRSRAAVVAPEQLWHGPGVLALAAPVAAFMCAPRCSIPRKRARWALVVSCGGLLPRPRLCHRRAPGVARTC